MLRRSRPLSVSLIAWFLIIGTSLRFARTGLLIMRSSFPIAADQRLATVLGMPVLLFTWWPVFGDLMRCASGIAMLRGRNWGRLLFLWGQPISLAGSILLFRLGPRDAMAVSFYLVILFFLTRPAASTFFMRDTSNETLE